jgi:autoinducer 2-binding protein LuxP
MINTCFADESYILVDDYYKNNLMMKKNLENFNMQVRNNNPQTLNIKQKEKIKIYMVYPGNQISDYWRRSKSSFEKRLQQLNINYELLDHFTKPGIEISKQAIALQHAMKNRADYLIFTLDAKKHLKFISSISQNNKTKVILQNITTPLKVLGSNQVFLYVGFDHASGTKLLAKEYVKQISKKDAKYAIMYGPKGYVSYMRGDTFKEYMNKNTKFQLIDSYYTNFDKQKAKAATLDLLKNHKDIDFIYSCSTDISLGIIEALKEKNLIGKIKVNGWGGGSDEIDALQRKEMDFTIMRMNDDNGVAMAEAIKLDLENKEQEIPLIFSGKIVLLKNDITSGTLKKLKAQAFRYSGY